MSAFAAAAPAALAALLVLAGAGAPSCGGRDGRLFRATMALVAGTLAFHALATLLCVMGVGWTRWTLLAPLAALAAAGTPRLRRRPPPAAVAPLPSWGRALAAAALAVFCGLAWRLWITTPDFALHWGLKGHRYFLAGGVDYEYLARPWNWVTHPDYPHLLPELYAATALLLGRFSEPAMMLWSAIWLAATLAAAREAARRGGAPADLQAAVLAVAALVAVLAGIGHLMAGGADWLLAFVAVAALVPLLDPAGAEADLQIGLLAALAAASKVEGVALGAFLVVVHGVARWRTGWRPGARALASLALPGLAVVGAWLWGVWRWELLGEYNLGAFEPQRLPQVAAALWQAMNARAWHGVSWTLVALLPLALGARRTRPAAVVLLLQLLFYLYAYFSASVDVELLVATSWSRLLLHLLPAAIVLGGVALGGERVAAPAAGAGVAAATAD